MADFHELLNLHPILKELLDWVDEPPPPQARDTHALQFDLKESSEPDKTDEEQLHPSMQYQGLMFFRPGELTSLNVNRLLGLEGAGRLVATREVCERVLGPLSPSPSNPIWRGLQWVQVRIGIRGKPGDADSVPQLFSQLAFFSDSTGTASAEAGKILGTMSLEQEAVPSHYLSHVGDPESHFRLANRILMESESHVPGGSVNPRKKWIMDLQKTTVLFKNTPP